MISYKTGSAKSVQLNRKDNISIEPYNSGWPKLAEAEIKRITDQLSSINKAYRKHSSVWTFK